ncbi:NHLP-related RiPP peptide [Lysobacter gummosus]|jgi:putative modified peptide|uniref:NHLP-related RiPP peptide n=1 Tax=Lysobacter gummosus TaxID=262324 RepID=A0ABY3XBS0_9GAMM|nr:NHLP-related RiPP peptide [Lysobacter gummosus]UNP30059.1 NHLP-related RiPP peptide [Lysobacter gummosus]
MANSSGHPGLDPAVVDKLLELLSSDDQFRDSFHKNPGAALAELGYKAPAPGAQGKTAAPAGDATTSFACMETQKIASKEEIQAAREELQRLLTAAGNHNNPHAFEAGRVGDFLKSVSGDGNPTA